MSNIDDNTAQDAAFTEIGKVGVQAVRPSATALQAVRQSAFRASQTARDPTKTASLPELEHALDTILARLEATNTQLAKAVDVLIGNSRHAEPVTSRTCAQPSLMDRVDAKLTRAGHLLDVIGHHADQIESLTD